MKENDPLEDLVAQHYLPFDSIEEKPKLRVWLGGNGGRLNDLSLYLKDVETLREMCWQAYAHRLNLSYADGFLYSPHYARCVFTCPADGGAGLCAKCATKEFKAGVTVAWSQLQEADEDVELECCDHCGTPLNPGDTAPHTPPFPFVTPGGNVPMQSTISDLYDRELPRLRASKVRPADTMVAMYIHDELVMEAPPPPAGVHPAGAAVTVDFTGPTSGIPLKLPPGWKLVRDDVILPTDSISLMRPAPQLTPEQDAKMRQTIADLKAMMLAKDITVELPKAGGFPAGELAYTPGPSSRDKTWPYP